MRLVLLACKTYSVESLWSDTRTAHCAIGCAFETQSAVLDE
jgi:hypothetical protein